MFIVQNLVAKNLREYKNFHFFRNFKRRRYVLTFIVAESTFKFMPKRL